MYQVKSILFPILMFILILNPVSVNAQILNKLTGEIGNGKIVTQHRDVASFDKIQVSQGLAVQIAKGAFELHVIADENLQNFIVTELRNGTLHIQKKHNVKLKPSKKIVVHVALPKLLQLAASSGSECTSKSLLSGDDIDISSSSGAELKLNLNYHEVNLFASSGSELEIALDSDKLLVEASSGSDVELSGSATQAALNASSGASIEAYQLSVDDCNATASSSGDIEISVNKNMVARATSGADISYKGSPENLEKFVSSGGDVEGK